METDINMLDRAGSLAIKFGFEQINCINRYMFIDRWLCRSSKHFQSLELFINVCHIMLYHYYRIDITYKKYENELYNQQWRQLIYSRITNLFRDTCKKQTLWKFVCWCPEQIKILMRDIHEKSCLHHYISFFFLMISLYIL